MTDPDYLRVIGVDPGPVPGIVVLDFCDDHAAASPTWRLDQASVVQCSANTASELVMHYAWAVTMPVLVQVEAFVVGHRSSRSSSAGAGQVTREIVAYLTQDLGTRQGWAGRVVTANAGRVKPWATDERLDRAGLLAPTKGMTHARDAARHALFCAVNSGGIADPLSKHWSK